MTRSAIVRADSIFEAVLGIVLVAAAVTTGLGAEDFPGPVGGALVLLFGLALLPVGALLWCLSRGPVPARLLRTISVANLATAAAALIWCLAASGFSTAGVAVTLVATAALALLGAVQLALSR